MSTKIRLARAGAKKRPYYRIVIADSRAPRDGAFIEKVGTYNPMLAKGDEKRVTLKNDRIDHWLSVGAEPSERIALFLRSAGIGKGIKQLERVLDKHDKVVELKKVQIAEKKKADEAAAKEEAKKKAEEEKAAASEEASAE